MNAPMGGKGRLICPDGSKIPVDVVGVTEILSEPVTSFAGLLSHVVRPLRARVEIRLPAGTALEWTAVEGDTKAAARCPNVSLNGSLIAAPGENPDEYVPMMTVTYEVIRHQRSSLIMSQTFFGRICLGCEVEWPCPDAPADGSDGWDEGGGEAGG